MKKELIKILQKYESFSEDQLNEIVDKKKLFKKDLQLHFRKLYYIQLKKKNYDNHLKNMNAYSKKRYQDPEHRLLRLEQIKINYQKK